MNHLFSFKCLILSKEFTLFIFKKEVLTSTRISEQKKKKCEKLKDADNNHHVLLLEGLFGIESQSIMRKCEFLAEI